MFQVRPLLRVTRYLYLHSQARIQTVKAPCAFFEIISQSPRPKLTVGTTFAVIESIIRQMAFGISNFFRISGAYIKKSKTILPAVARGIPVTGGHFVQNNDTSFETAPGYKLDRGKTEEMQRLSFCLALIERFQICNN